MKQVSNYLIKSSKLAALTLALALGFSNAAPVSAQKKSLPALPNRVEIANSSAVSDNKSGALVEWQSSYEVNTLGYNVYRVAGAQRVLVNSNLIPGSIAEMGEDRAFEAGKAYSFFDPNGTVKSNYVIEAVMRSNERRTLNVATRYDRSAAARAKDAYTAKSNAAPINPATVDAYQVPEEKTAEAAGRLADFDKQRWVAAQPGVKIAVKNTGLYRVTRQQLADAGFDVNVPTANWQLYVDGIEQAVLITGEENGFLGASGYIEFFGTGFESFYTDKRVYYLVVGTAAGKRMNVTEPRGFKPRNYSPNYQVSVQCRTTVAADCNKPNFWAPTILNGDADNWFGSIVFTSQTNVTMNLPSVSTGATEVTLEISLQGFLRSPHVVTVLVNNNAVGTVTGVDYELMQKTLAVPSSLLRSGNNTVTLQGTGGANDASLIDFVRINYNRQYQAANNALLFKTAFNQAARVNGFSAADIRVFDVTDGNNVSQFRYTLQQNGLTYSAVILTSRPRTMFAVANNQAATPVSITANAPSNFYDTATNKDLLIVSHKDFVAAANTLAAQRQNQGLTVSVLDVEDVYDEFSYGAPSPAALKAFFARTAPRYGLLVGDASVDARNYVTSTFANFVPTFYFDTGFDQVVTDELLGDTTQPDPDYVAEFPVGRLAARNLTQANTMVNKIIAFENAVRTENNPFARGALFINDTDPVYNFYASNSSMIEKLPQGTPIQRVDRANYSNDQADQIRGAIVSGANQGPYIVGYAGHGTLSAWASINMFRSPNETDQLAASSGRSPMYVFLTCLNGAFADHTRESLAESIMNSPGGGVLVWSSSGRTIADGQDDMGRAFYTNLANAASGARVGDLMRPSKFATFDTDVRTSWILLGDPSMRVK